MPFLGIDVGTSSTKALICGDDGRVIATATAPHPLHQPHPGWTEQDPRDWWTSSITAIHRAIEECGIDATDIRAVGLSGQMHGSVLLGEGARTSGGRSDPLRPAILWNDQRTAAECRSIEESMGGCRAVVEATGNAPMPGFMLPKLLWVRSHEPETWSRTRLLLLPKDFIAYRLTGACVTDTGDASGTLLFDIDRRCWNSAMVERFDIDPSRLPNAVESAQTIGTVSTWAASQTGLRAGTPVAAGSGDNMTAAIGAGVTRTGQVLAVLGTSGVILAGADAPHRDLGNGGPPGRLQTMAAATGAHAWCIAGCTLSAAGALGWARDVIAPGVTFDDLLREAGHAPPGCDGLLFLPYLTGERCPHPDPSARGAWIGLTSRHRRGHLTRAVIEGVTFTMAQILDLVRGLGVNVRTVRLSGGGNRSAFWRHLQAALYRCPVETTNTEASGSALGAALLGATSIGAFPTITAACDTAISVTESIDPPDRIDPRLTDAAKVHADLYATLSPAMHALSAIDRS